MKIIFIQTGGTIDKDYPHTTKGWAFEFGEPATTRVLEKLNPSFEYEILTAFQKDSLEITDADRRKLAVLINEQSVDKIIITHGSDTMMETASYLSDQVKNKLIIITGAMRPEQFSNSDAPINIGCAIAAANLLDEGTYIAMHGVVKPFNEIKRNLDTGKYY
ncbi:MAG TPA: asparaginase domain-containing protein [Cyclobacteriaceae bacterium]|jgi:L-asparaginase|nr:asparaginase domain-containing protein [Cyclobacteriaceae bacterium]